MLTKRIIPCLDVHNGRVVKGINFVSLRDAGDPVEIADCYSKDGADELVLLDISASAETRSTMREVVKRIAGKVSIPLTVGGGIGSVDDIRGILMCGADKVSLNTTAVKNPVLIAEAAKEFGSRCIMVAVDARAGVGGWTYIAGAGLIPGRTLFLGAEAESLGAGKYCLPAWTGTEPRTVRPTADPQRGRKGEYTRHRFGGSG